MALVTPVIALLMGNVLLVLGTGLQSVLIPVRASLENFSPAVIGIMGAAYYAGYVAGCLGTPHMVKRVGHTRAFAALAVIAAQAILIQGLVHDQTVWIGLRAVTGLCFSGLATIVESWINEKASNEHRGKTFSIYLIVCALASTAGNMLMPLADPRGLMLFAAISLFLSLSILPLVLSRAAAPRPLASARLRLGRLYRCSPVGVVGTLFVGFGNGAFWALAPLYAQMQGLPTERIAVFMAAAILGGAVGHYPFGWLSDHWDRRKVMLVAATSSIAVTMLLGTAHDLPHGLLFAMGAAFGLCGFALSPLCTAHANDHAGADACVETSSGLQLIFGVGAVVGPMAASPLMAAYGAGALFLFVGAMHLGLASFAAWRIVRRAPVPIPQRRPFGADEPVARPVDPVKMTAALKEWTARSRADGPVPLSPP